MRKPLCRKVICAEPDERWAELIGKRLERQVPDAIPEFVDSSERLIHRVLEDQFAFGLVCRDLEDAHTGVHAIATLREAGVVMPMYVLLGKNQDRGDAHEYGATGVYDKMVFWNDGFIRELRGYLQR